MTRGSAANALSSYRSRAILQLAPLVFAAAVIATIVIAWINRNEGYLTAETGAGYWLGIAGALIMLFLIAYPLRKRFRAFANTGRVANWFRLHMMLGIIGPTLVVLHTNFKLGSLNSRLALFTMLIVVASGIVGRYLYARVHKGLYGRHVALHDILADLAAARTELAISAGGAELRMGAGGAGDPMIMQELERLAPKEVSKPSLVASAAGAILVGPRARTARRRILARVQSAFDAMPQGSRPSRLARYRNIRALDDQLKVYFAALKKAERLAFFDRLFGLWHHLHMPLFVLLTFTVIMHIIAVHRY